MLVGGCTGGTASGLKVIRMVVAWALRGELRDPLVNTYFGCAIDDKPLQDRIILQIGSFFFIFVISWELAPLSLR